MSGLQIGFGLFKAVTGNVTPSDVVFFDTADPNTGGTVFDPNTPEQTDTLYVSSSDGSTWVWDGLAYLASGGISGSGTNNYVARWTPNGTTLGTGVIQDNGSEIGLNCNPDVFNAVRIEVPITESWSNGLFLYSPNGRTGSDYSLIHSYTVNSNSGNQKETAILGQTNPSTFQNSVQYVGVKGLLGTSTSSSHIGEHCGVLGSSDKSGKDVKGVVGTIGNAKDGIGLYGYLLDSVINTVANFTGVQGYAYVNNTTVNGFAIGVSGSVNIADITNLPTNNAGGYFGATFSANADAGSYTIVGLNATGVRTSGGSGVLETAIALKVSANNDSIGTITNKWGIYQVGAGDSNYFAGSVGIGTSSFSSKVAITGTESTLLRLDEATTNAESSSGIYIGMTEATDKSLKQGYKVAMRNTTGENYAFVSDILVASTQTIYGLNNSVLGTSSGVSAGVYNVVKSGAGNVYGIQNVFTNPTTADIYGISTQNTLSGASSSNNYYGNYSSIDMEDTSSINNVYGFFSVYSETVNAGATSVYGSHNTLASDNATTLVGYYATLSGTATNKYGISLNISDGGYIGLLQDGSEASGSFLKCIDANGTATWGVLNDITLPILTDYSNSPTANAFEYDCDLGASQHLDMQGSSADVTLTFANQVNGATYSLLVVQGSNLDDLVLPSGWWLNDTAPFDFSTELANDERALLTASYIFNAWYFAVKKVTYVA